MADQEKNMLFELSQDIENHFLVFLGYYNDVTVAFTTNLQCALRSQNHKVFTVRVSFLWVYQQH